MCTPAPILSPLLSFRHLVSHCLSILRPSSLVSVSLWVAFSSLVFRLCVAISDGSNVIITCHLGLDIPGDDECLMWVGVDMERRAWRNNK